MTYGMLMNFMSNLFYSYKSRDIEEDFIKARCIWRDENGGIVKEELHDIGYCSGLKAQMTIEMGFLDGKKQ